MKSITLKKIFITLSIILINISSCLSLTELDSLLDVLGKTSEQGKSSILSRIAAKYWFSNPQKSFTYSFEALGLAIKYSSKADEAGAFNTIGVTHLVINQNDSAFFYLFKSLAMYKEQKDTFRLANNLRCLADVYSQVTDYDNAQEFYIESYKMFEKIITKSKPTRNQLSQYAIMLNNFGGFLVTLDNYNEAIKYFEKSILYYEKLDNNQGLAIAYFNIGDCWGRLNNEVKAMENLSYAYTIAMNYDILNIQSSCLQSFADLYIQKKDFNNASKSLEKVLPIVQKIQDRNGLYLYYIAQSKINSESKNFQLCIFNLNNAQKIANEMANKEFIFQTYKFLSDAYEKLHDYPKSILFLNKYIEVKDSVFSVERADKISRIKEKLSFQKRENETEKLKHSNQIKELNNNRLMLVISFLIAISLLSIITLIIFRKRNAIETKLNLLLTDKNNEIVEKNSELEKSNVTKDLFMSIIAHDLKNPLGNFKQVTELLTNQDTEITEKERNEFLYLIKESSSNIYGLLENLLEWSSSQRDMIKYYPTVLDISTLINETVKILELSSDSKNIKITNNVPDNTHIYADNNMIKTILRNLISNAIKFTPNDGKITIEYKLNQSSVEISIIDNGIGIDKKNINKLFKIDEKITSIGTNQESGSGLGLILCQEFIERNNGKIWVESEINKGSTFTFSLPIDQN